MEQALGWVATKSGFCDMIDEARSKVWLYIYRIILVGQSVFQDLSQVNVYDVTEENRGVLDRTSSNIFQL